MTVVVSATTTFPKPTQGCLACARVVLCHWALCLSGVVHDIICRWHKAQGTHGPTSEPHKAQTDPTGAPPARGPASLVFFVFPLRLWRRPSAAVQARPLLVWVPASSIVCNTCLELMARGKGGGRAPRSKQAAEVRLCVSLLISSPRSGAAEGWLPGWPGQTDILLQQVRAPGLM